MYLHGIDISNTMIDDKTAFNVFHAESEPTKQAEGL